MEDLSALEGMKRAELQRLAKKAGIKANLKTDAIIQALKKHYNESGSLPATEGTSSSSSCSENNKTEDESAHSAVTASESESATSSTNKEHSEQETSENALPKRAVRKGRKGRKRTTKAPVKTVTKTPEQVQKPAAPAAFSAPKRASRSVTLKTDGPTAPTRATPVPDDVPLRRKTRSVAPKTNGNASQTKITPAPPAEVPLRRKTRSVTPKNNGAAVPTAVPANEAPVRRRTYEIEQELAAKEAVVKKGSTCSSSDLEMKQAIMAELEQMAEDKMSHQSRIPKPRTVVAKATKPITPGNKDWSRIHQAQFDKMESIDDYVTRKRKRTETLSASVKRAKVIADEARVAVQKLTSHRTPQGSAPKIAKPVPRRTSTKLTFSSPKPSVTKAPVAKGHTEATTAPITKGPTKSVSFKVSRLKTPTRATVLLGGGGGQPRPKRKSTPGPRKSVSAIETSAKKPTMDFSFRKSMGETARDNRKSIASVTPFKFGQTSTTTPGRDTASKPVFDLKTSLRKPLTYKPHAGKLKPLEVVSHFQATSNIQKAKASVMKKPTLKTRDDRRAGSKRNRANKRANNQMARRGISAL